MVKKCGKGEGEEGSMSTQRGGGRKLLIVRWCRVLHVFSVCTCCAKDCADVSEENEARP